MFQTLIQFDTSLLASIRQLIDPSSSWQIWLIHTFADLQVILVAVFLVVWWIVGIVYKNSIRKFEALRILYIIAIAFMVYMILNQLLPMRPRPEDAVNAIAPLINHVPDNSFPSGHAIFFIASTFAFFITLSRKWIAWTSLILGVIMCFARVAAGVHFPGDIFAGWIIGLIFAVLAARYLPKNPEAKIYTFPIKIASFLKL